MNFVEQNQDFRGQSIYHELRNYPKTYFSGQRMLLFTINNNLELEHFLLTQHFAPKSAKFRSNSKNDSPSGACAPPRGTIF